MELPHQPDRDATSARCGQRDRLPLALGRIDQPTRWGTSWLAIVVCAGLFFVSNSEARAQLPQTKLLALFPTGGQAGTTVEVTVTSGADLERLESLVFDHPGISCVPKRQGEAADSPIIPNQFVVTIAGDVPAGRYEVRCKGLYGLSNPRVFVVGNLPDIKETETNNPQGPPADLLPDQTVNGRMNFATDLDWYKFTGTAGQRVLLEVACRSLDSRLDAAIELYDARNRRLASARASSRGDALLDATLPADGEYTIKLYDFVFGGGEDYPYRLTWRTAPYIDFTVPNVGVPGTEQPLRLYGRNLPGGQPSGLTSQGRPLDVVEVTVPVPADRTRLDADLPASSHAATGDSWTWQWASPQGVSNRIRLGFSSQVPRLEVEPNNSAQQFQQIEAPLDLCGAFQTRGDADMFQFTAKAGQVFWIEVQAQRIGSAADPRLVIDQVTVAPDGKESLKRLAAVDDDGTNPLGATFETISDDPLFRLQVPEDSTYRVTLRDRFSAGRGDPSLVYHLAIRPESPDFRVLAVVSAPTAPNTRQPQVWGLGLRKGDQAAIEVMASRRDGFAYPIRVRAEGLPPGITSTEVVLSPQQAAAPLVLIAAEDVAPWQGPLKIVGAAVVDQPEAVASLQQAEAKLMPAIQAAAAAKQQQTTAVAARDAAQAAAEAAKVALAANPEDANLQAAEKQAAEALAKAVEALTTATNQLTAADQLVSTVQQEIAERRAARDAAKTTVAHEARYGTIVWNSPQPNVPGPCRITRGLSLSILDEPAAWQLVMDSQQIDACHGRQILIPAKLLRRAGFDNAVNFTFQNVPQNVQVENKPIAKEQQEEVFRVFVPANAPVGTYVLSLVGQQQVPFSRDPKRLTEAQAELAAVDQRLMAAKQAVDENQQAVTKLTADVTAATEAHQQSLVARDAAAKQLTEAQAAEQAAREAIINAGDDAVLKAAAEEQLKQAMEVVKTATQAVETATNTEQDRNRDLQNLTKAKTELDAARPGLDQALKTVTDQRAAAEKKVKDTENAVKPQNINHFSPAVPLLLTIRNPPVTVAASFPASNTIRPGESLDVNVEIKRVNNFAGPVTVRLEGGKSSGFLSCEAVTIPADQTQAVLKLQATAESPEGAVPHLVVRATAEFEGTAIVDQPVAITVAK